jgi:hypothetical protein
VSRPRTLELAALAGILAAQAFLLTRPIHAATTFDEDVYLAALDALRHGQALGSDVFAAQFPGFYDLLRGLSYVAGIGVTSMREALVGVMLVASIGGWLLGRHFAGAAGGLLVPAFLAVAPSLDLFSWQVLADPPALALMLMSAGVATLGGVPAAVAAGALFGAALSVKLTALTVLPLVVWLLWGRLRAGAIGAVAVVVAVLLAHAPALGSLWTSGVVYHDKARSTPAVMPHADRRIFEQISRSTPFFWLALAALILTAIAFVRRRPLPGWQVWSWVVLSVVFLLLHKPLHDNHLVVLPFTLAVATAVTIAAAFARLPGLPRRLLEAGLALVLAAGLVQQVHRLDTARAPEPETNIRAAAALDRLTPPGALVADDKPIVSFLAHRRVVGPLVDMALLRFETGSLTDAKVIESLGPAKAVVVSRALRSRPGVLAYLRNHFQRVYSSGGVQIFVR